MRHDDPLIARLAAANPVPAGTLVHVSVRERLLASVLEEPPQHRGRVRRRTLVAALVAAAVAVPAAAFADRIGQIFGLSNQGTPVATSRLPEYQDTKLAEAIREMQWPAQMQLLGERNGVTFYATRKANGEFCFAMDAVTRPLEGVSCVPPGLFPSPKRPIIGLPVGDRFNAGVLAGFAADGIARVNVVDAAGATIVSAPVADNLYAAVDVPQVQAGAIVALDGNGNVLYRQPVSG